MREHTVTCTQVGPGLPGVGSFNAFFNKMQSHFGFHVLFNQLV
jgi:hypothetical protein